MDFSLGFMDLWAVNLDGLLKLELNGLPQRLRNNKCPKNEDRLLWVA